MKRRIKLTESDLHRVIKESVKNVLREHTNSFNYDVYEQEMMDVYENKINDVVHENLMDKIKEKYKEKQRKKDRERCKQAGEGDGKDYM